MSRAHSGICSHTATARALHKWVEARKRTEKLFRYDKVERVTFMSVAEYEQLMALVAAGIDVFRIMHARGELEGGLARFDVVMSELAGSNANVRLRHFDDAFEAMTSRIYLRLFGRMPGPDD